MWYVYTYLSLMMPSGSGSLDAGGIDVEAVDSIDGPRLQSGGSVSVRSESDRPPDYHRRVRVAALTSKVQDLEAEVDALERAVESEERRRQQVIDSYEAVVAARPETDRAPDAESAAPAETATAAETAEWRPLDAVASGLERLAARLRRSNG